MVHRDAKCVFVTESPGAADAIVNMLEHEGIAAQVMDRSTLGGFLGLTLWSKTGVSSRGLEVWVVEEKDAVAGRNVIAKFEAKAALRKQQNIDSGPVEARCEECGEMTTFAGKERGSVQDCPHCGAYMDVAGGEEDFDWSSVEGPLDSNS